VSSSTTNRQFNLISWLDILTLLTWGSLLLKYVFTGQLRLLIHPNYFALVLVSSIVLLVLGSIELFLVLTKNKPANSEPHITLLSPRLASSLLLSIAIAGWLISPQVLTSETAIQRGLGETLPLTRLQPESFRTATKPEERSLIDWVRTINAYPEPDAYSGQPAKISGFVVYSQQLPDNYVLLSRFIITCCAVDAYPIGIPVKLDISRTSYPQDTWLEVTGTMNSETLILSETKETKRQLVLAATSIEKIPTPPDPYSY
jgi:putative membrane protein